MSAPRQRELREQLRQLRSLELAGALPQDQAQQAKARLERELLDLVMSEPEAEPPPAPAPVAAPAMPGVVEAAARPPGPPEVPTVAQVRASNKLKGAMALFVVAVAGLGYTWLGSFAGLSVEPQPRQAAASAPHETGDAQIRAMTERLAARLKQQPDDAEGWVMLGRTYSVTKQFGEAAEAFRKALALRPKDAQVHADLADAVAMVNGRKLEGEPAALVAKALTLDSKNLKALALSGALAFERGDTAKAATQWQAALQVAEPGSDMAKGLESSLAEVRPRGVAAVAAQPPAAAASATVSGTVTLAPALQAQVLPSDTLFVFARPAQGSRMPLAILRKQAKDLPLEFTLDDSLSMSPAARLSGATDVVVGARISKSGNAVPQAGDLTAQTDVVKVGSQGLRIEIGAQAR